MCEHVLVCLLLLLASQELILIKRFIVCVCVCVCICVCVVYEDKKQKLVIVQFRTPPVKVNICCNCWLLK